MENLLIEQGGKSVSLFGPTYLWNLLRITTLFVYLALLVYLAPESSYSWVWGTDKRTDVWSRPSTYNFWPLKKAVFSPMKIISNFFWTFVYLYPIQLSSAYPEKLLQAYNFLKISFVYHFIKKDSFLYTASPLIKKIRLIGKQN